MERVSCAEGLCASGRPDLDQSVDGAADLGQVGAAVDHDEAERERCNESSKETI